MVHIQPRQRNKIQDHHWSTFHHMTLTSQVPEWPESPIAPFNKQRKPTTLPTRPSSTSRAHHEPLPPHADSCDINLKAQHEPSRVLVLRLKANTSLNQVNLSNCAVNHAFPASSIMILSKEGAERNNYHLNLSPTQLDVDEVRWR